MLGSVNNRSQSLPCSTQKSMIAKRAIKEEYQHEKAHKHEIQLLTIRRHKLNDKTKTFLPHPFSKRRSSIDVVAVGRSNLRHVFCQRCISNIQ
jgi:hypothetical protein